MDVVKTVGHKHHGKNSQWKLLENSWLHTMGGGNLLMGKFLEAMLTTPIA